LKVTIPPPILKMKFYPTGLFFVGFSLVTILPLAAQPKITVQPLNVSVQMGKNAQFAITASGSVPLRYQWRHDGRDLAGATNLALTVANVALSSLGRYDVIVSDSTAMVTSAPVWLLLARWTELVTFGRSDSSSSCAPVSWPDHLANQLGVRLRKYAALGVPGLPSTAVEADIIRYLSSYTPSTNTLFAIWNGGVDLVREVSVEESVARQLAFTRRLADGGAHYILMPRLWPPKILAGWAASFPFLTDETVVAYDALLDEGLKALQAEFSLTIYRPEMFAFIKNLSENLVANGFREPLGSDFSCDGLHFTTAVHRLNAQEHYRSLTPPTIINAGNRLADGALVLDWIGGSMPFRVEGTTDLGSGQWNPVGEVSLARTATVPVSNSHHFFRILRLGQ
jgi:hypothetical protein